MGLVGCWRIPRARSDPVPIILRFLVGPRNHFCPPWNGFHLCLRLSPSGKLIEIASKLGCHGGYAQGKLFVVYVSVIQPLSCLVRYFDHFCQDSLAPELNTTAWKEQGHCSEPWTCTWYILLFTYLLHWVVTDISDRVNELLSMTSLWSKEV